MTVGKYKIGDIIQLGLGETWTAIVIKIDKETWAKTLPCSSFRSAEIGEVFALAVSDWKVISNEVRDQFTKDLEEIINE